MFSNSLLKHIEAYKRCFIQHLGFFSSSNTSKPFISLKLTPQHNNFPFQDKVSLLNTKTGTEKSLIQRDLRLILGKNKILYMATGLKFTLLVK